ncbi:unnamed protein product [Prunus armeniaca]|uniref:Pentatricopeptide repeat-containing protein n=1 Tax=Prunus armeniaca TaxID=36596 RepID=A0A6J5UQT0_PRUAR|nr:unnamed protein product [Prunus armeniaca]
MELEGFKPDEVTMIGVVSSCAQLENLRLGRKFHRLIEENGLSLTVPLANSLMDILLYEIPEKNVVPWNAMIGGYVQAKHSKEALALFHEMQASNINPDEITMVGCLCACSQIGALDVGIWIHHYIEKHGLSINVAVGTALVDMYAKCGNITKALEVFWDMPGRNSFTWTAIICGLALNGHAHVAISYFAEMINTGLVPDEITFLGVLSACCHGGLVEDGRRAGLLQEAEELIHSMPIKADAVVWGALFFACYIHKMF